jgi:hypothetical protein
MAEGINQIGKTAEQFERVRDRLLRKIRWDRNVTVTIR